jgi:hypothetical protein
LTREDDGVRSTSNDVEQVHTAVVPTQEQDLPRQEQLQQQEQQLQQQQKQQQWRQDQPDSINALERDIQIVLKDLQNFQYDPEVPGMLCLRVCARAYVSWMCMCASIILPFIYIFWVVCLSSSFLYSNTIDIYIYIYISNRIIRLVSSPTHVLFQLLGPGRMGAAFQSPTLSTLHH